jgi:protein ImuB
MFAALYIPNFSAQAVLRAEAALVREQPLAVLEGAPPLTRVMAMNEAARHAGVESGMTKLQAQALPGLVLRSRSSAQENSAHAALLDCAAGFSPRVEALAAGTIVLDLEGVERLFGPPPAMARELAQRAASLGLEANIAVAANVEAAIHAARGFSGVTVIPAGAEAERLATLPVEVLIQAGLPADESLKHRSSNNRAKQHTSEELLEIFDRWGVRTFRAFALLPTIAVAERLGQRGVAMQKLARGEGLRQLTPAIPELRFEEALELEHPIENLESLAFALNRLLEQLCSRLEARALAANELRLKMELEDNRDIERLQNHSSAITPSSDPPISLNRVLRLPVPMRDPRLFLRLWQLELNAHPPQAPVTRIFLAAEPAPPQLAQHGLFMPLEPQPERLELMLARIAGIVGSASEGSRAGAAELLDTNADDAFRMERFAAAKTTAKAQKCEPARSECDPLLTDLQSGNAIIPSHHRSITLALRRFRPPHPATVELRSGAPAYVDCAAGPRGEITWAAGPWRSSGEWWSAADDGSNGHPRAEQNAATTSPEIGAWWREEWDVRIAGGVYRLVRKAADGAWSVDGMYD